MNRLGPFKVGDRVRHATSGRQYVVTRRWRDPGMRSYDYEVESIDGHCPDVFHRGEIVADRAQAIAEGVAFYESMTDEAEVDL